MAWLWAVLKVLSSLGTLSMCTMWALSPHTNDRRLIVARSVGAFAAGFASPLWGLSFLVCYAVLRSDFGADDPAFRSLVTNSYDTYIQLLRTLYINP